MPESQICKIRRNMGLTQVEMAAKASLPGSGEVCRLETGEATLYTAIRASTAVDGKVLPHQMDGMPEQHRDAIRDFAAMLRRNHARKHRNSLERLRRTL